MPTLLKFTCTACDCKSQPYTPSDRHPLPPAWEQRGERLLCGRCVVASKPGRASNPALLDPAYRERLGLTFGDVPKPAGGVPVRQCADCESDLKANEAEVCAGCTFRRANPRYYRPDRIGGWDGLQ